MGRESKSNVLTMKRAFEGEILPFNIHFNGCPKCGTKQHTVVYCVGVRTNPECPHEEPHLHRCCQGCQFMWSELTLDDPETPAVVKFRANPEVVLAIILSGVGGSARFAKGIAVRGMVTAEEVTPGVIEVKLVPDERSEE